MVFPSVFQRMLRCPTRDVCQLKKIMAVHFKILLTKRHHNEFFRFPVLIELEFCNLPLEHKDKFTPIFSQNQVLFFRLLSVIIKVNTNQKQGGYVYDSKRKMDSSGTDNRGRLPGLFQTVFSFLLPISRYLLLRTQHFLLQQWEFMKHL